ncbi:MAG: hypothetical protein IJE97_11680, partial [Thermoguttaceae bacterium]|nr:hypothetical protein [Thermoguttaceae bacterium]
YAGWAAYAELSNLVFVYSAHNQSYINEWNAELANENRQTDFNILQQVTLGHELGHLFTLDHQSASLMAGDSAPYDDMQSEFQRFTSEQLRTIQAQNKPL